MVTSFSKGSQTSEVQAFAVVVIKEYSTAIYQLRTELMPTTAARGRSSTFSCHRIVKYIRICRSSGLNGSS